MNLSVVHTPAVVVPQPWRNPDHYIVIEGRAVRVAFDDSSDLGPVLQVNGLCPECGDATEWEHDAENADRGVIRDRSCGKAWALEFGVPGRATVVQAPPHVPFFCAGQLSLHVDTIARVICQASLTAAGLPSEPSAWDQASPATRSTFREHAIVAVLRTNAAVNAIALSHARMFHGGGQAEAAIDTYHRELVKHAPIVGGSTRP